MYYIKIKEQGEKMIDKSLNSFNYLVVDAGYRKNGTHNDNTVVCSALNLSEAQKAALLTYNENQHYD